MVWLGTALTALANIKALAGYLDEAAKAITLWYLQKQQNDTLASIADAAAFAARAKTEEDRYAAAQKWRDALSRPRISP